jgi:hypothetical protein
MKVIRLSDKGKISGKIALEVGFGKTQIQEI